MKVFVNKIEYMMFKNGQHAIAYDYESWKHTLKGNEFFMEIDLMSNEIVEKKHGNRFVIEKHC